MPAKQKTCKWCNQKFTPRTSTQTCCGIECAYEYARKVRNKAERVHALEDRKTIRIRKEAIKTRSQWMKEAQVAFNAYIRERDKEQLCICCDKPLSSGDVGGAYDCGHYRSVGSAPHLRFDPRNAHAQRKQCNRWGAGRAVDYRLGLIARIGIEAVESLESDQGQAKHSIEDLKAIISTYKAKLKELQRCKS